MQFGGASPFLTEDCQLHVHGRHRWRYGDQGKLDLITGLRVKLIDEVVAVFHPVLVDRSG